ncbi:5-formyltetrahydrofolate cyclo-ligase [Saccharothrix yanglingensis]|uniref:5-formyltetrahydrofolate cyclo-ligase n=1 Tax=Saccharothrix yanglingensis TaxID=659496 RepID=A0ABU0WXN1_9PSEU|nr:5-formyltetrahydrofolate cyclo-ligase [Saccharothrix yanglingensis]MDQ2584608.1 5-formyltetrahydrofolate cyclo-ligase [Saccharothrix yanglingensis]
MTSGERDGKATLRARLRSLRRGAVMPSMASEAPRAVAAFGVGPGRLVCAYAASAREPGSVAMLDALVGAGYRVLLPVVVGDGLAWAPYDGRLRPGAFGLPEPVGTASALPAGVALVLVPALAVDHAGVRLGKGGGYYDRALASCAAPKVAVVRDEEFVPVLPAEPHDVRVDAVLTPSGLVRLPLRSGPPRRPL